MTPISGSKQQAVKPTNTQAGFTLLEILLVLTIIGMASVLVVPNLTNLDSRTFDAQVRQATSLLNYARRFAVVNSQPAMAVFVVADDQAEQDDEIQDRGTLLPVGEWRSEGLKVRFRDSTDREIDIEDRVNVVFYPEGGSTGGTMFLSLAEQVIAIEIDPFTGRISSAPADQ